MNHCFMSCNIKHSNLQLPRDSSVAVAHIQRLIPKGRGSKKQPYDELPELQSSCHKFCVVMVVSDGLRSTLIWSKCKNFPREHAPRPPWNVVRYTRTQKNCARRMAAPPPTLCVPPPSSISGSTPAKPMHNATGFTLEGPYVHFHEILSLCN